MTAIKKILLITVTVLMVFSLLCVGVSASDVMTITVSDAEGERGELVEVVLNVESNPGFAGMRINVPSTDDFEVVDVKNGTIKKDITVGLNILWDSVSDSTATGTLVTITFRIGENAKFGENVIIVKVYECCNAKLEDVTVNIEPIKINVLGGPIESVTDETTADVVTTETDEIFVSEETVESETESQGVAIGTEEDTTNKAETETDCGVTDPDKETDVITDETQAAEDTEGGIITEAESTSDEENNNPPSGDNSNNDPSSGDNSNNNDSSKDEETTLPKNEVEETVTVTEASDDKTDVRTEDTTEDTTEDRIENTTDLTIGDVTDSAKDTSASEESTKAEVESDKNPDKSWGCGSSISFGALFSVVLLGALTFIKKKKDI